MVIAVYDLLTTGLHATLAIPLGLVAAGLLAGFLYRQRRAASPLLPLRLLTSRRTGVGNLAQAWMVAGLFGFQCLGVIYVERQLGYSPLTAGLAFLPVPVVIAAVSLGASAHLIARLGQRPVLAAGLVCIAAGLALPTQLPDHARYLPDILPAALRIALGFRTAYPALAGLAVASAPPTAAGVASGLFNTTQQLGGALGLALLTRLATSHLHPAAHLAALTGYHLAFTAATGLVIAALLLTAPATAAQATSPRTVSPRRYGRSR